MEYQQKRARHMHMIAPVDTHLDANALPSSTNTFAHAILKVKNALHQDTNVPAVIHLSNALQVVIFAYVPKTHRTNVFPLVMTAPVQPQQ
jgi:hypothetical protein